MISSSALYTAIMSNLQNYNNGDYQNEKDNPRHLHIMEDTIVDYFEANLVVTYSWTATNTSGTSDPITSFNSGIVFSGIDLMNSGDLDGLAGRLQVAFANASIVHPTGFTLPVGVLSISNLSLVSVGQNGEDVIKTSITDPLCAWAITLINSSPLSGAHGAYTGSAVMTSIS